MNTTERDDLTQEIEAAADKYSRSPEAWTVTALNDHRDTYEAHYAKIFRSGANLLKARVERLEEKLQKLKALMLLTAPVVSGVVVSEIEGIQWNEFIKCFPDEGKE